MPPDVNWKFQFQIEPTVERVHGLVPQLMPLEGEEEDDVDRRPRAAQQPQNVNQHQNAANNLHAVLNENRIADRIRNRGFNRTAGERYFRARREMYEARRQNHGLPPVRHQPSTSGIAPSRPARRN
ncbi:hypothetical protein B9Z55_023851 [Caenorhabditis nigoni]|uniref:Uncharacterized protein n=1 Tax=Caenorhabditis nigoni TaxID=1611254 RepID=A0A2G5SS66_9PELO|nr:hypothetical protein B9Z55_023851 [Caenorhabditis nigoni]